MIDIVYFCWHKVTLFFAINSKTFYRLHARFTDFVTIHSLRRH